MELIGGIISGIIGVLGAVGVIYKIMTNSRTQAEERMSTNFQKLFDTQADEIKRMKQEIAELRTEQARERQEWAQERAALHSKIDELTQLNNEKDRQIAELQGQVTGLKAAISTTNAVIAHDKVARGE